MRKFTITYSVYGSDEYSDSSYITKGHTLFGSVENDIDAINELLDFYKHDSESVVEIESIEWED